MILLADSEGPDQAAHPRRLIRAFAVCLCPKRYLRTARPTRSPINAKAMHITDTRKSNVKSNLFDARLTNIASAEHLA